MYTDKTQNPFRLRKVLILARMFVCLYVFTFLKLVNIDIFKKTQNKHFVRFCLRICLYVQEVFWKLNQGHSHKRGNES